MASYHDLYVKTADMKQHGKWLSLNATIQLVQNDHVKLAYINVYETS
jgi:hypothetical protein